MNGFNSIVCGVDGSRDSGVALRVASELAERLGLRLVLVHAVDPVSVPYVAAGAWGGPTGRMLGEDRTERRRAATALLEQAASAAGIEEPDLRVVDGFAAERLADVANEERAAFVVVGSRGRGAFKAALLGSVSTGVIHLARCPVLVVPHGAMDG
jgi:nucleotide-binding universal stress UspA family protein